MKKNISIWMLGIAAVLASCSQNEELLQSANEVQTVTLTARMNDMATRAVSFEEDDDITQCRLELWQDGQRVSENIEGVVSADKQTCTFTFTAKQGAYDVLLWASDDSYTADDLSNVTVSGEQPGIAYFRKEPVTEITQNMTATLTHAVAKVTLKTTTLLPADAAITVTVPTYSAFNVNDENVTGSATAQDFQPAEAVAALPAGGGEVFSFYVLAPVDQSDVVENVTITYNGENNAASNVPLQANYRTVLSGDLAKLVEGSLTATLDKNWAGDEDKGYTGVGTITTTEYGQITSDVIQEAMANGATKLIVTGPMNSDDLTAIKTYLAGLSGTVIDLDISDAGLTAIPAETFYGVYVAGYFDERIKSLGQVSLPITLSEIGKNAFRDCPSFTIANWNELTSLTTIGVGAFMGSGLSGDITLPENIKTIEQMAFYQTNITSIAFPSSITTIGRQMLYRCYSLKKVVFKGDITSVGNMVFGGCSALEEIDFSACATMPTPDDPFNGISTANINKIKLIVNEDLVSDFAANSVWGQCQIIDASTIE